MTETIQIDLVGKETLSREFKKVTVSVQSLTDALANTIRSEKVSALNAEAQKLAKSMTAAEKEAFLLAHALDKGAQKATMSWTDFRSMYQTVLGVARSVYDAFQKIYKIGREGAGLEFTAGKFDRLSESIGTTSDALMTDLKEATRGMYSDFDLMASATDFLALGLAKDHDGAVRLAAVSSGLNMNMNQLVLTLTNMTTMRFDALGVRVDGFKEKVKALEEQGYSTNDAFKEAFLQQAEEQLKTVGNAADSTVGSYMKLEAGVKNLTDEMKTAVAVGLVPVIDHLNKLNDAIQDTRTDVEIYNKVMAETGGELVLSRGQFNMLRDEIERVAKEYRDNEAAIEAQNDALNNALPTLQMTEEQLKEITEANKEYLSSVGSLTKEIDTITDKEDDLKKKHGELLEEKKKLINQGWWAESEQVQAVNNKLAENETAQQDNAKEFELATWRRILARAEEELAVDGLDDKERDYLLQVGLARGVYTQEAVDQMKRIQDEVDNLINKYNDIPSTVRTNIEAFYYTSGSQAGLSKLGGGRAAGGPVSSGTPYMVGERGPELFVPNSSGNIIPNGKGGGHVFNINITADFADPETIARKLKPAMTRVMREAGVV